MLVTNSDSSIRHTRNGLLLVTLGLVGPVIQVFWGTSSPWIQGLFDLVTICGYGLLIVGRKPFGFPHTWLVPISAVIAITSVLVLLLGALVSANALDFLGFFGYALVFQGAAWLLLTYALQRRLGRLVLWTGFFFAAAAPAALFNPRFWFLPVGALVLFATANILAWIRIVRREIPRGLPPPTDSRPGPSIPA
ncbi:MAG TPA: hypothetical protein VEM95_01225 [Thermoplasmata archaeon]|nr:hypothetical protein [Thermoplasmata archaeon]